MLGTPRCFSEAAAEPRGCVWPGGDGEDAAGQPPGMGRVYPLRSPGTELSPLVLDFLDCRKDKAAPQPLLLPAVVSSQTPRSCFTPRGRQELSNTRAPLSSNGGTGALLPHREEEEGSGGAARAVLSSGQMQLEPSAPHPERAIPQQFGFPLVTGYGCEVTQGRSSG